MWNLVETSCKNCGSLIKAFPSRKRVYCSDCSSDRRVEITCPTCGLKKMTHKSNNVKYCSRDCFFKSRVGIKRPEHICKKISATKMSMPIKTEAGARRRFNKYLYPNVEPCENCGEKDLSKIDRHHIDKDIYNTDQSNLMYLCKLCHQRLHKNWEKRR